MTPNFKILLINLIYTYCLLFIVKGRLWLYDLEKYDQLLICENDRTKWFFFHHFHKLL